MDNVHDDKVKHMLFHAKKSSLVLKHFFFFGCCHLGMLDIEEVLKNIVFEVHEFGKIYYGFLVYQLKPCG